MFKILDDILQIFDKGELPAVVLLDFRKCRELQAA